MVLVFVAFGYLWYLHQLTPFMLVAHWRGGPLVTAQSQTLLVIGANDGTNNDHPIVTQWLRHCSNHTKTSRKVLLVEPNPSVFKLLENTVQTRFGGAPGIIPVNALISSKRSTLHFTTVNSTMLLEDCPAAPHWALYQLGSVRHEHALNGLRGFLNPQYWARVAKRGEPTFKCNLTAIRGRKGMSKYLIDTVMTSVTIDTILSRFEVTASDVEVLAVDTEGHDAIVVADAFRTENFLPWVVIHEHKALTRSDQIATEKLLRSKSYIPRKEGQDTISTLERHGTYIGPR